MGKKVLLFGNLGSPDSTEVKDVRKYLREFLMDKRVIDIPYALRTLLVKGIIAPFRAPKSAAKYRKIWTDEGSPLIVLTEKLVDEVIDRLDMPVYMYMRYANPTPSSVLQKMYAEHDDIDEIILFPLYPHYAMSSYETAVVHLQKAFKEGNYKSKLTVVEPYYDNTKYIHALANSIKPFLRQAYDHVLFSYHGIPKRHLIKTDPTGEHCMSCDNCCETPSPAHAVCYRHQVIRTTELVADELGLPKDMYSFSFQSRLGTDKWLMPYTDERLENFPKEQINNLVVISPAFISDCLETLEEIHIEGRETFLEHGGKDYRVVPCLNTNKDWLDAIDDIVTETIAETV